MAAKAFVLIEVSVGRAKDVAKALAEIKDLKMDVNTVTGPYDIIVILEGKDLNEVGDVVTGKIHPIVGISRTVTCLVI